MDDKVCIEGKYPQVEYKGKVAGQKAIHDRPITVSGKYTIQDNPCHRMYADILVICCVIDV